jgi:hypothetical protein
VPSLLFTHLGAATLALAAWCRPALGQWSASAEVGVDRFWGGAVESSPEELSLRPYRTTTFGVGLERLGRLGTGLRIRYASAGLSLEGDEAVTVIKGVYEVYSVSPELILRIASVGSANRLVIHAGPLFEVWSATDEESQTRVGLQGALSLRVPLGGRFTGSLTAGVAVIPSPFTSEQLEPDFERRALWRRRVAGGLEYRL